MDWWTSYGNIPAEDLQREELLLERTHALNRPLILTYSWTSPTLVLGYAQDAGVLNLGECRRRGITVIRRCSGGTGVFHRGDLGISLALPAHHPWARGIGPLYDGFVTAIQEALAGAAIETRRGERRPSPVASRSPICFADHATESLLVDGLKVLGCAQARRKNAVLVHGALLLHRHIPEMAAIFDVSEADLADVLGALPHGKIASPQSLGAALAASLARSLGEDLAPPDSAPDVPPELHSRIAGPKWVILAGEHARKT